MKWLKKIYYKYFVKWKFLQSMIVLHIQKNGKKYLIVERVGEKGLIDRKTYLVEHLVNENYEVTDQTLKEEEKWFMDLSESK